jgi:DNA-binding GntR family transcriptional regulator
VHPLNADCQAILLCNILSLVSPREQRSDGQTGSDARRRDRAYLAIRDGILTGTYGPNQRLTEMDLSTELGVSRQTVGIALVRLEHEGLVVTQPNRGASVRSVSVAEALRALRVREALEGVAASLAAQFVTPEELAEMDAVVAEMRARHDSEALVRYSQLNTRLHELIVRAARDETVDRMLASLNYALVRYQSRTVLVPGRLEKSLVEHQRIVEALRSRDPASAEEAARRHVARIRDVLEHSAQLLR